MWAPRVACVRGRFGELLGKSTLECASHLVYSTPKCTFDCIVDFAIAYLRWEVVLPPRASRVSLTASSTLMIPRLRTLGRRR